jgi:hypothetical protein
VFCLPHRVSLVLAVEGIPVHWQSVKSPKPSGSCPLCRAHKEGEQQFEAALKKWIERGRKDPSFLVSDTKDSEVSSDKDKTMNFDSQQKNKARLREENNRKIMAELKRSSIPGNNKRSREEVPAKKPNHLRLIKE